MVVAPEKYRVGMIVQHFDDFIRVGYGPRRIHVKREVRKDQNRNICGRGCQIAFQGIDIVLREGSDSVIPAGSSHAVNDVVGPYQSLAESYEARGAGESLIQRDLTVSDIVFVVAAGVDGFALSDDGVGNAYYALEIRYEGLQIAHLV